VRVAEFSQEMMLVRFGSLIFALTVAGEAVAHDYQKGTLFIDHPWTVASLEGDTVSAGYLTITNKGDQSDWLVAVTTSAARKVTMHTSSMEDGVSRMRLIENGIEIRPGETVEMKPGGTHVMFEGLTAYLFVGGPVKATLLFEKAGEVNVQYVVVPIGSEHSH
jgi:periplasmic copper chaperone A